MSDKYASWGLPRSDGSYATHGLPKTTVKHWRSQIHFLHPLPDDPGVYLAEVPAWDEDEPVRVHLVDLPPDLAEAVRPGYRCHARARLAVTEANELDLRDWEIG